MINWDDFIRDKFAEYFDACYSGQTIRFDQRREVEQAFLSGIHVLNAASDEPSIELIEALQRRLLKMGSLMGQG